jgi:hypothetical protein
MQFCTSRVDPQQAGDAARRMCTAAERMVPAIPKAPTASQNPLFFERVKKPLGLLKKSILVGLDST